MDRRDTRHEATGSGLCARIQGEEWDLPSVLTNNTHRREMVLGASDRIDQWRREQGKQPRRDVPLVLSIEECGGCSGEVDGLSEIQKAFRNSQSLTLRLLALVAVQKENNR